MALFPAFSGDVSNPSIQESNDDTVSEKASWLQNESYAMIEVPSDESTGGCVIIAEVSKNESSDLEIIQEQGPPTIPSKRSRSKSPHRSHKKKKKKSSKSKKSSKDRDKSRERHLNAPRVYEVNDDPTENFYEDRKKERGNLTVDTLHRPAIPLYSWPHLVPLGIKCKSLNSWKFSGRKRGRYYMQKEKDVPVDVDVESGKEIKIDDKEESEKRDRTMKEVWKTPRLEQEVQHATELFNSRINKNPQDVRTWLEFLRFQDRAAELQFRGGRSKRALAQRKIDILEKALRENPRSWLLQREKVHLEKFLYPPDELEQRLGKEAEKTNNPCVWMAYLEVLRSRATTTEVTVAYGKAMDVTRREGRVLQRRTGQASIFIDEQIVDLLFNCGLYMRQAGLWERLWTLLRMYLELHLKPRSRGEQEEEISFDIAAQPADSEVEELENEVFKSGLPLSEIWLRIEGLRQSARWLPLAASDKDDEEGDLQRIVFPEDVSELLHPLSSASNILSSIPVRLASVVLLLLKVPLLPCRDTALRRQAFPLWSCDTPEVPLTAVFSGGPWDWGKGALPFDLLSELIAGGSGPQYLLSRPGRDLYLKSIQKLFLLLTDIGGSAVNQQYFGVWWLRFERWLITLEGCKTTGANFSLPPKWKKELKSTIKEFLLKVKNRSSLALYREYALIDASLGKEEGAIQTLCKIATVAGYPVVGGQDQAETCSVYRVLAELLLKQAIEKQLSDHQAGSNLTTQDIEGNEIDSTNKVVSNIKDVSGEVADNVEGNEIGEGSLDTSISNLDSMKSKEITPSPNAPSSEVLSNNDKANLLVEGANTKDVISLRATNVSEDVAQMKQTRWDVTKHIVGAGGRRPRWTAAGVFMGTVFYDEKVSDVSEQSDINKDVTKESPTLTGLSKSCVNTGDKHVKYKNKTFHNQSKVKNSPSTSAKINLCSSYEGMTKTVLTRLGLGKPLGSLDESVDLADVKAALQKYKHVFQEELKEELSTCSSPEEHSANCKCKLQEKLGVSSGLECFQSYFLVEWVCCWAWLLSLVYSTWNAGAVFEETLSKLPKITVEQMEVIEEYERRESERNSSWVGGRYNPTLVRLRNIREAVFEGYISLLLANRWSSEGRSGLNVILADVIRRALCEFPENVYFAAAVAISENDIGFGGSPWWKVTSYFDGGLGRAGGGSWSVFGKIFLVLLAEQRRRRVEKGTREAHLTLNMGGPVVEGSGGKNRLRSVLRHLVADSGTRSCPLLWRLYLRFVGGVDEMEDCKGVAYRGLQQCPWVKAFYLDAGRLLPEEINQFQDMITEKELRLHVSPEELEILRT